MVGDKSQEIIYVKHESYLLVLGRRKWGFVHDKSFFWPANILSISVGIGLFVSINAVSTGYQKAASQPFANLGADLVVQRAEKNQPLGQGTLSMQGIKLPFSNQIISSEELTALGKLDGVNNIDLLLMDIMVTVIILVKNGN
jgi:hypothetical protein